MTTDNEIDSDDNLDDDKDDDQPVETKSIFELYGIDPKYVHPDVDHSLNTIKSIKDSCRIGTFFKRFLKRIDLIDDFRSEAIACAGFDPATRRVQITFNPFLLWGGVLRLNADNQRVITTFDDLLTECFKNGGWTADKFNVWIEFVNSQKRDSYISRMDRNKTDIPSLIYTILIHEIMHCLWNHISYQRTEKYENPIEAQFMAKLNNIAMDFAINQTLNFGAINHHFMTVDNRWLLNAFYKGGAKIEGKFNKNTINIKQFDDNFLNQPFEYYLNLLKKNSKKDLEEMMGKSKIKMFSHFGNFYDYFKHVIGEMTAEQKQQMADSLAGHGVDQFDNFNQTTSDMKKVSANDMKRVIDEMLASGEISKPEDFLKDSDFKANSYFTKMIEGLYKTDTVSWERALQYYLKKAVGSQDFDHTMKREHRSVPDFFPGLYRGQGLDVVLIVDVSGSINHDDYNRFLNEIEKMDKIVDAASVRFIQFHSEIALDKMMPVKQIRKTGIASTGGTCLGVALKKLKKDVNSKLTIVFTDGYIENEVKQADYNFPVVLFCSSSSSQYTVEGLRKRFDKVIYQDEDNSFFLK